MNEMVTNLLADEPAQHIDAVASTKTPRWMWDAAAYLPAFVGAPALGLGIAGLSGAGPGPFRERRWLSMLSLLGGAALLAKWQLERFFLEKPDHAVMGRVNGLELRQYEPRVVAETVVADALDWDTARSEGFRRLAAYIYGSNQRKELTAPTRSAAASTDRERLPMTAPVTMQASPQGYLVRFGMPKGRRISELPIPTDTAVALRTDHGGRVATLRFRGTYDSELVANKEAELVLRAREAGLEIAGETMFAGYDAPSTLPFLRRIEVWVPIA